MQQSCEKEWSEALSKGAQFKRSSLPGVPGGRCGDVATGQQFEGNSSSGGANNRAVAWDGHGMATARLTRVTDVKDRNYGIRWAVAMQYTTAQLVLVALKPCISKVRLITMAADAKQQLQVVRIIQDSGLRRRRSNHQKQKSFVFIANEFLAQVHTIQLFD